MDKIDLCLIPLIYLFRTTLIIVSALTCIPRFVKNTLVNTATWFTLVCIHILLFALRWTYYGVRMPVNLVLQSLLFRILSFWPKFYWHLFKPDPTRRSIWQILTSPVPPDGPKAMQPSTNIPCLNGKYYCHSFYQVQGAFAHLHQRHDRMYSANAKELDE